MFKDIYLNTSLGVIYIPSTHDFTNVSPYPVAYDEGVDNVLTVFSLGDIYNSLPLYNLTSMYTLSYRATYAEITSQEYMDARNDFITKVRFIVGDLDHGGIFCYKHYENNMLYIGVVYGFGRKEIDGTVYYWHEMGWTNDGLTVSDLAQVGITFNTTSSPFSDEFPSFQIHTASVSSPLTVWNLTFTGDVSPVPTYEIESNVVSLANATNDYNYFSPISSVNHLPMKMWRGKNIVINNTDPFYDDWQGSWTGDAEISPEKDPSIRGGTSNTGGGNGDYPTKSDDTRPDDPNSSGVDAIGTGFITLYNPTKAQVKAFNDYLFSDSITSEISNQLKKLIADPIDYLVFIAMCHFKPITGLSSEEISFVGISTGVSSKIIPNQMQMLDCGVVHVGESTNSARDYSPYSKCQIFLPYVGFRELNIEEIMGSDVHVTYDIDLLTGSFACHVWVERPTRVNWQGFKDCDLNGTIAVFEGNCFELLPLSSTDFRNFYSGLMGVVGGGISAIGGNLGGLGAMGSSVMGMKTNVNRSGNATGSFGYNSKQKPYLVLSRPFQAIPLNMGSYEGYPSNIYGTVESFKGDTGYLEVDDNTVWGTDITFEYDGVEITAFDDEIDEIKQLFNTGVYVNV